MIMHTYISVLYHSMCQVLLHNAQQAIPPYEPFARPDIAF